MKGTSTVLLTLSLILSVTSMPQAPSARYPGTPQKQNTNAIPPRQTNTHVEPQKLGLARQRRTSISRQYRVDPTGELEVVDSEVEPQKLGLVRRRRTSGLGDGEPQKFGLVRNFRGSGSGDEVEPQSLGLFRVNRESFVYRQTLQPGVSEGVLRQTGRKFEVEPHGFRQQVLGKPRQFMKRGFEGFRQGRESFVSGQPESPQNRDLGNEYVKSLQNLISTSLMVPRVPSRKVRRSKAPQGSTDFYQLQSSPRTFDRTPQTDDEPIVNNFISLSLEDLAVPNGTIKIITPKPQGSQNTTERIDASVQGTLKSTKNSSGGTRGGSTDAIGSLVRISGTIQGGTGSNSSLNLGVINEIRVVSEVGGLVGGGTNGTEDVSAVGGANGTEDGLGSVDGTFTTRKLVKIGSSTKNKRVVVRKGTVGGTRRRTSTIRPKTSKPKIKPSWPYSSIQSQHDLNVYRNYTQIGTNKVGTNKAVPNKNELKQDDYYLYHIPSPDPRPEVTSHSGEPQVGGTIMVPETESLVPVDLVETSSNGYPRPYEEEDEGEILDIPLGTEGLPRPYDGYVGLDAVETSSNGYPEPAPVPTRSPTGQVDFNMVPLRDVLEGTNCPSLHLSTNVFGPQQKQISGCPDLNIVVNSHFQQSMITERAPAVPVEPVVADPVLADAPLEAAVPIADSAVAPVASAPVSSGGSGGGWGGWPGFPSLPDLPKLPDLKGVAGLLRGLWSIISWLWRFIWPVLVAVPTLVFLKTLLGSFLVLFPWWFPAIIFAAKWANVKEAKKGQHVHYKHVYPVQHHPDGWFWNHNTKTWTNVFEYHKGKRTKRGLRNEYLNTFENGSSLDASIKHLTTSLLSPNGTNPPKPLTVLSSPFDTRTPPKIKQHHKHLQKPLEDEENSHPGVAEPVDLDKNLYDLDEEKPTTENGLSTWILLSGERSSTVKSVKRISGKNVTNSLVVEDLGGVRGIKPLFRRRNSTGSGVGTTVGTVLTTPRSVGTVSTTPRKSGGEGTTIKAVPTTSGVVSTTPKAASTTVKLVPTTVKRVPEVPSMEDKLGKLTKVKASVLASAKNATKKPAGVKVEGTTKKAVDSTTQEPSTEFVQVSTSNSPGNQTESLKPEAKEGELELTTKKPKRGGAGGTKKRKKNKKKKPQVEDRVDVSNSTKIAKPAKEKPFGTQIYNYLSREVMPTVGVGLVGLMVTAGLASYFLYPFGPARRSYEALDRKDTQKVPHFYNEYSGGISEEEAIGKVIAGMPTQSFYKETHQKDRNSLAGRYRKVDQRFGQGTVETVHLNPKTSYKTEDVIVGTPKLEDTLVPNQQFVVGNVPKELQQEKVEVVPAVVPEHGPRNLDFMVPRLDGPQGKDKHGPRRKRQAGLVKTSKNKRKYVKLGPKTANLPDKEPQFGTSKYQLRRRKRQSDEENEIASDEHSTTMGTTTTSEDLSGTTTVVPSTTKNPIVEKSEGFIHMLKDLLYFKLRLGFEVLQNKTASFAKYLREAQIRLDEKYKNVQHL